MKIPVGPSGPIMAIRTMISAPCCHTDRKTIAHPEAGPLTLDYDVFTVDGSDLRIIVFTADPASTDADKLSLVRTIGLQGVTPDAGQW